MEGHEDDKHPSNAIVVVGAFKNSCAKRSVDGPRYTSSLEFINRPGTLSYYSTLRLRHNHQVVPATTSILSLRSSRFAVISKTIVETLYIILNTLLLSIACQCISSVINIVCVLGDWTSGKPVQDQSNTEYLSGLLVTSAMVQFLLFDCINANTLAKDRQKREVKVNMIQATLHYIYLLRRVALPFQILTLGCIVASMWVWESYAAKSIPYVNGEWLLGMLCLLVGSIPSEYMTRKIGREEKEKNSEIQSRRKRSVVGLMRLCLVRNSVWVLAMTVAAIYVNIIHTSVITKVKPILFASASIVFKLCMQEGCKKVLVFFKVYDLKIMVAAISTVTIIIDTQTRVVLRFIKGTQAQIQGAFVMSLGKVGVRIAKLAWIKLHVRRLKNPKFRKGKLKRRTVVPEKISSRRATHVIDEYAAVTVATRTSVALNTAELYADMCSEYIALFTVTSVIHIYLEHPYHQLLETTKCDSASMHALTTDANAGSSSVDFTADDTLLLFISATMNLVADTISCFIEVYNGLDYRQVRRHTFFILAMLTLIGITNYQIFSIITFNSGCP